MAVVAGFYTIYTATYTVEVLLCIFTDLEWNASRQSVQRPVAGGWFLDAGPSADDEYCLWLIVHRSSAVNKVDNWQLFAIH